MPGVEGRPRSTSPSPEECKILGEEMIAFIQQDENDILHLSEWYTVEKMMTYNQWKAIIQIPQFLPYYEKALKLIGKKYLDKNSSVNPSISQRWQRVYFKDLKEEEDETVKYNESVKSASVQTGDTYVVYPPNSAAYSDGQIPSKTISKEHTECS